MYIELDLVAGKVENINKKKVLEGRKEKREDGPFDRYLLNKYNISKQQAKDVLLHDGDVVVCSQIDERNEDWFHILRCISET